MANWNKVFFFFLKQQIIGSMSVVKAEDILYYVNQARTNPKKFAKYIEEQINQFMSDNRTLPLVPKCNYSTNEGKGAWIQCKQVLDQQKPLLPYKLSKSLTVVAQNHAKDMSKHNFSRHNGSDGSQIMDRINRLCQKPGYGSHKWGEVIGGDFNYKERNHALNTVKSLLIDDGVQNRGHRKSLLSQDFTHVGIGSGMVDGRIRVVIDLYNHDPSLKSGFQLKQKKQLNTEKHKVIGNEPKNNYQHFETKKEVQKFKPQERYPVSTKKSSSSSTINGKTTTKTVEVIVYSDGTTETNETISTR